MREKIGQKLYKYVGDKLVKCRLTKVKNDNCFVVKTEDGIEVKLTKDQYSSYAKLREDGLVILSTVLLDDNVPDVIVSMFRLKDIPKQMPYAVCRHNIFDVFSNTIANDDGAMFVSCSVSQDTCPSNIEFPMLLACNSVTYSEMIAIYYDDQIEDILGLVQSTTKFNDALYTLNQGFDKTKTRGSVSTLRELLVSNNFIDDIRRGFNILKVNFEYNKTFEPELTMAVEDIIKREMIAPVWMKFDRDIDLSLIKDKFILIMDNKNDIYVISYIEGKYSNRPYLAMGDTTEVDALKNLTSKI